MDIFVKMRRLLSLLLALLMVMSVILAGGIASAGEVSPYKDVKVKRWSYPYIKYVTDNGLMNGTSADRFEPESTMTRAMVVTVLHRLQGEPAVQYKSVFSDVKKGTWYTDAVLWAAEKGIVNGKGDNKFAPMEDITREQLAAIMMRYAPLEYIITEERADIKGFADYKKITKYAREAMAWANAVDIVSGVTEDTLAPQDGATREQFATILKRFKEYDNYKYEVVYNEPVYGQNYVEPEYPIVDNADIYVATDGNDNNDGKTVNTPVKTFERRRNLYAPLKRPRRPAESR